MLYAYIGTYAPNGEGVYLAQVKHPDGELSQPKLVAKVKNGAQLVLNSAKKVLYVASEVDDFQNTKFGAVYSYQIQNDGSLKLLNQVDSQGAGPVYLALHPSGKFLFVANYLSGSIAVLPIKADGSLDKASDNKQSHGQASATQPQAAPIGSFAISGHDGPHAHMVASSADGQYVFATDLGLDRIYQWRFDVQSGKLSANRPAYINAASKGAGPRHFIFHPQQNFIYLVNEEASTVTVYRLDPKRGVLTEGRSISTLPANFKGTNFVSGVVISADGKYLYVANRLHNSISQFLITQAGDLKLIDNVWVRGDYPRTIVLSPSGNYLYVLNQRSDHIVRFSVDEQSGKLHFIDNYTPVGSPSQMVFMQSEQTVTD